MRDLFRLIGWAIVDLFRSRAALEAEIWTLRQQINVLRRAAPKRLSFSVFDRLIFAGLYRLFLSAFGTLAISFWPYMIPFVITRRRCGTSFQSGIHVLGRGHLRLPADADLHSYQLSGIQGQGQRDASALRLLRAVRIKSNLGF